MNPEINVKCRSIIFKYHTLVPKEIIFHVPIFCNDKDKNMILFFYHSLLPFGGTDLKMKTTAINDDDDDEEYKEQLFALNMHFGEFCEMYTMASYISTLCGENTVCQVRYLYIV